MNPGWSVVTPLRTYGTVSTTMRDVSVEAPRLATSIRQVTGVPIPPVAVCTCEIATDIGAGGTTNPEPPLNAPAGAAHTSDAVTHAVAVTGVAAHTAPIVPAMVSV